MPKGYGVPNSAPGMVPWETTRSLLERATSYWLVTIDPDGKPHLVGQWGAWIDDRWYFEGGADTKWARNVAREPRIAMGAERGTAAVMVEGDRRTDHEAVRREIRPHLQVPAEAGAMGRRRLCPHAGEGLLLGCPRLSADGDAVPLLAGQRHDRGFGDANEIARRDREDRVGKARGRPDFVEGKQRPIGEHAARGGVCEGRDPADRVAGQRLRLVSGRAPHGRCPERSGEQRLVHAALTRAQHDHRITLGDEDERLDDPRDVGTDLSGSVLRRAGRARESLHVDRHVAGGRVRADAREIRFAPGGPCPLMLGVQRVSRVKKRRMRPGRRVTIEVAARCHAVTAASSVSTSTPVGE